MHSGRAPHRWALPRLRAVARVLAVLAALQLVPARLAAASLRLVLVERHELPYPTFVEPVAIAAGPLGQLYVADSGRGTVLRLGPGGRVEYAFESPSTQPGLQPLDLEVTGFQVYVLDALSNALLRYSQEGGYLDLLQSFTSRAIGIPRAVSVDGTGRVLLAYPNLHAVHVIGETQETETVVGGFGSRPGQLAAPSGVAFAPGGTFYVADTGNRRLQRFDEVGNFDGTLITGLGEPRGVAAGADGVVCLADARGSVYAFATDAEGRPLQALLALPDTEPVDTAIQGDTVWVLSREPRLLLCLRLVRGE